MKRRPHAYQDDYDNEFRTGGRPLEPLRALDGTVRVMFVGSFSKTMLPILRMRFAVRSLAFGDSVQQLQPVDVLLPASTPLYDALAVATATSESGRPEDSSPCRLRETVRVSTVERKRALLAGFDCAGTR